MRQQVYEKREKFTKEIRAKQHQQYFQLNRQANKNSDLPAIAYLPALIENQLYDDIEAIMDCIDMNLEQNQTYAKLINTIREKEKYHSNQKVRFIMFKLLNRLNQWTLVDLSKAVQMLKENNQQIVKQLSIYFEVQLENVKESQTPKLLEYLGIAFKQIIRVRIHNIQYRLFWLDIICQTLQHIPNLIASCLDNSSNFLFAIDLGLSTPNQFQTVRVLRIINELISYKKQIKKQIIHLECFPKLIKAIQDGSIDVLLIGLDIFGQLLSSEDDTVVFQLVNRFNVLKLYKKYINHIMIGVQTRVIWGLSNITGSQCYKSIYNDQTILQQILKKSKSQPNPQILSQSYCCLLNLICNLSATELQQFNAKYQLSELIMKILEEMEHPLLRDILLERVLFSIFHMLNDYPSCYVSLQQFGLKKLLLKSFQNQQQSKVLGMINELLKIVEKRQKQSNNCL